MSEFQRPDGKDGSSSIYQFQWLYGNGLLATIFTFGVLWTSLKTRKARSWRYGTGQWSLSLSIDLSLYMCVLSALTGELCRMDEEFHRRLWGPTNGGTLELSVIRHAQQSPLGRPKTAGDPSSLGFCLNLSLDRVKGRLNI